MPADGQTSHDPALERAAAVGLACAGADPACGVGQGSCASRCSERWAVLVQKRRSQIVMGRPAGGHE